MIHGFWARLFSPQAPGKFAAPRHEAPALEASYIEHLMGLIGCLGLLKFLGFQPVVASEYPECQCPDSAFQESGSRSLVLVRRFAQSSRLAASECIFASYVSVSLEAFSNLSECLRPWQAPPSKKKLRPNERFASKQKADAEEELEAPLLRGSWVLVSKASLKGSFKGFC